MPFYHTCAFQCYRECKLCLEIIPQKCGGFSSIKCKPGFYCSIYPIGRRILGAMYGICIREKKSQPIRLNGPKPNNEDAFLICTFLLTICFIFGYIVSLAYRYCLHKKEETNSTEYILME